MVNPNCIICSEVFGQDTEVMVTRCGHLFHNGCIRDWIQRSQTCPQCRNTDTALNRVYLNWDPAERNVDNCTVNELLDGANLQVLETERNLSSAEEEIRILTQAQQQSMDMISELEQKIEDKDGQILSYREASNQVKEEIEMLQTRITSLESELQTCEDKRTDLSNLFEVLKIDFKKETDMRKASEERVSQLESDDSNSDIQSNQDLEGLKEASEKKAAKQKKLVGVLQKNLKMMREDLSREAQLRIDERLLQLENNIIKAVIREEIEQGSSSKNKCTSSKASPNTEKDLLQLAKKKAKDVGWKSVWERKGRILARKDYTSEVLYIGNVKALRQMI